MGSPLPYSWNISWDSISVLCEPGPQYLNTLAVTGGGTSQSLCGRLSDGELLLSVQVRGLVKSCLFEVLGAGLQAVHPTAIY